MPNSNRRNWYVYVRCDRPSCWTVTEWVLNSEVGYWVEKEGAGPETCLLLTDFWILAVCWSLFFKAAQACCIGGSLIKHNSKHRCNIINDNTNTAATGKSVNWLVYFTSMCLCLWLLLDGMSEWWKNGTAGGAGNHHGWKKWKRRTAAAKLLIIVIGVLLLTTLILIPHIFNPSTLLFSPSPSTVFVFVFHSSTLYTYTSTVYGIYYAAHYILWQLQSNDI